MLNIYIRSRRNSTANPTAAIVPPYKWGRKRIWVWRWTT